MLSNLQRAELLKNHGDELLFRNRDLKGAIAAYRESLDLNPNDAAAHHDLGVALNEAGDLEGAIGEYREAIRLSTGVASGFIAIWCVTLGDMLHRHGDLDGALASYRKAALIEPQVIPPRSALTKALSCYPGTGKAIELFWDLLSLRKDAVSPDYAWFCSKLREKGDFEGTIELCRTLLSTDQADIGIHYELSAALKEKGDLEGAIVEFEEWVRLYKEWLRLHPGHPEGYCGLGAAMEGNCDFQGALVEYEEAVRIWVETANTDLASQLSAWRDSLDCCEDEVFFHLEGASLLEAIGDIEGAVAEYKEILRLGIEYEIRLPALECLVHRKIGDALLGNGMLDAAIAEYREGLRTFSEDPSLHFKLGLALEKKGHIAEALE